MAAQAIREQISIGSFIERFLHGATDTTTQVKTKDARDISGKSHVSGECALTRFVHILTVQ